jgi:flagellar biosynthesis component FlhA
LYSDYTKLPIDKASPLSTAKNKKPIKNKPGKAKAKIDNIKPKAKDLPTQDILNQDLKAELMDLENEFKERRQELRQAYKERRKQIYQKYGVKPPKNQRSDSDARNLKNK